MEVLVDMAARSAVARKHPDFHEVEVGPAEAIDFDPRLGRRGLTQHEAAGPGDPTARALAG